MHSLETVEVYEQNRNCSNQLKSRYEIHPDKVEIYDIVWGDETFDDPIFAELANHDALRRLQTVEQLTLPDRYKTIPGSTHFSRWEHAWGSAIFAGRLGQEIGLSDKEVKEMQLKALLSDVCHTAHSHAGDWILQGIGKQETLHDFRRINYAEQVGLNEILRRYGYSPTKILKEHKDGIIDADMPDLDVDRIDYTLREAYRWVDQIPQYRSYLNKHRFIVKDDKVVCTDKMAAKVFGISYILLATEHWQEPAHRLQLELFMETMKRVLVAREGRREAAGSYSPLDMLMVTDDTLKRLVDDHDDYIPMLHELMRGVSEAESTSRWRARSDRIRVALESGIGEQSKGIEWIAGSYDTLPRSYEIEPAALSKLSANKYVTVLRLGTLRKRTVDPLYWDEETGEIRRLSETDKDFVEYAERATQNVQQEWRAGIIGNAASTTALKACLRSNREHWAEVLKRPRMPSSVLRELLRETVRTSNGAASEAIECHIHG